ncbi:head maturation protease, ClpP-related [Lactobacillus panisapium]|uniref:ATP-dependent Clp protease proteolytic subunit n=1 Tax=Lactobacillus panisapium TaxID=2012495 RepID=A0ABX8W648_9LACO|nr:head maturation protease, ClpP-related [Lactobacillus panisapium]QYN53064.1 Clp protease ClpP [Lactobacillus panisapium]
MKKIEIKGPIIDDMYGEFVSFLGDSSFVYPAKIKKELDDTNDDVVIEINSRGGYTSSAAEIYTILKQYQGNVEVHVVGEADSAASIIAMAGDNVLMSPMAMMMIHRASTDASGNADDLASGKQALDELDQNIVNAYATKTGKDEQDIFNLMAKTTWMNAKTAVQEGFADGIMEFENDNVKQNYIAKPMLNATMMIPHFKAEKILEIEKLIGESQKRKNQKPKVEETKKDDKTKLVNYKLGLLFGGK